MSRTHIDIIPFLIEIHKRVPYSPEIGIVCGSGLSDIAQKLKNPITIPYDELGPSFPHSAVPGHKNEIVCGELGSKKVICFRGRFHFYEGWTPQQSTLGIRIMAALGVKLALITNAAGGLDPSFQIGDVMLMDGHINFIGMAGFTPLLGTNNDAEGPRFPPLEAYNKELNQQFADRYAVVAKAQNHPHVLRRGAYVGLSGPSYESRHEVQLFRNLGAHSVGMSTTNEVVVASHVGIKVVGLSLITNSSIGTLPEDELKPIPTHEEVVLETKKVEAFLQILVQDFVDSVDISELQHSRLHKLYSKENLQSGATCPATGQFSENGVCPATGKTAADLQAEVAASGCTLKCPLTCPTTGKSGSSCPFMWATLGGIVGAVVGVGLTVAYAHAPLVMNRFRKDE